MRLPVVSPKDLSPEQKPLYEDMKAGIAKNFPGLCECSR